MKPLVISLILLIIIAGCGGPKVARQATASADAARVYLIRPNMRYSGATDRAAKVLMDEIPLVSLDKGTYALFQVNPGQKMITVKSYTHYGKDNRIIEVTEQKLFHFLAGESYYIYLEPYYRGYRWGTSFRPKSVDHAVALREANKLKAKGAARSKPLAIE